jgi:hypothetical protein
MGARALSDGATRRTWKAALVARICLVAAVGYLKHRRVATFGELCDVAGVPREVSEPGDAATTFWAELVAAGARATESAGYDSRFEWPA